MTTKSQRREQKRHKARHGMQISGRSVKTLLSNQTNGSIGFAAKRKKSKKRKGKNER